jgi:DUF1365 family protein
VKSRLYVGSLRHRRHLPRPHAFRYRVFMPFLHLGELDAVLALSPFWSRRRLAPARFRREDFHGDPALPLDEAVRRRIESEVGERPAGPIYLLANLRYFGYQMNPLACYYCFDEDGETLRYLVAEVTNTPWNERHSYRAARRAWRACPALPLRQVLSRVAVQPDGNALRLAQQYARRAPGDSPREPHERGREFDATLALKAQPISAGALRRVLLRFPLMTAKVALAIYWQALKLFLKTGPYYPHPGRHAIRSTSMSDSSVSASPSAPGTQPGQQQRPGPALHAAQGSVAYRRSAA